MIEVNSVLFGLRMTPTLRILTPQSSGYFEDPKNTTASYRFFHPSIGGPLGILRVINFPSLPVIPPEVFPVFARYVFGVPPSYLQKRLVFGSRLGPSN